MTSSQGDVRSSPMAYPAVRTLPKLPLPLRPEKLVGSDLLERLLRIENTFRKRTPPHRLSRQHGGGCPIGHVGPRGGAVEHVVGYAFPPPAPDDVPPRPLPRPRPLPGWPRLGCPPGFIPDGRRPLGSSVVKPTNSESAPAFSSKRGSRACAIISTIRDATP